MHIKSVGFIGLGCMGRGMAINLVRAGVALTVYDINPQAMAALAAEGAAGAQSAADLAARVDLLFLCLPDAPEVHAALFGDQGVARGAHDNLPVVDTTTLNRAAALELAALAHKAGLGYSDCPISGLPRRAEDGTLTMMFGGELAAFEAAQPCLQIMGESIIHCGALGSGQMMKAINNIIYDVNIATLCEVLPMAVKAGLDAETVVAVVNSGSSRSFASDHFLPRILDGRFDSDFAMNKAYKDIVNIQQIATRVEACTPVVNAMISTYQNAIAMGLGDEPKSAMIKVYERILGQAVRRAVPDRGDLQASATEHP